MTDTIFNFLTLDALLLIILLGFIGWGFGHGFIRAIGGLIGIFVAAFVAGRYYLPLSNFILAFVNGFSGFVRIFSFAVLFLLVGRLFGYLVLLVERAFDIVAFLPFLKAVNRLAGALFGLVLGVLVIGTILYVAGKYSEWETFNNAVIASRFAQYLVAASTLLRPLLPEALRELKSYF